MTVNDRHPQNHRTPRPRNSVETRAGILRAAERIFAEAGLEGARTDAIARAAGVNKAMLYYYFKSKTALYSAVLKANAAEFHRGAEEVLSGRGSAGTLLLRYVSNHLDFIGARPFYPRLIQRQLMAGDRTVDRLIQVHSLPIFKRLAKLVEEGMRSGEFRRMNVRHTLVSVAALTVFYFNAAPMVRKISGVDVFDKAEQARRKREVLQFIRNALFTHPEANA